MKPKTFANIYIQSKLAKAGDFPGGPVVKTASNARSTGPIPGQGTKIPHAMWHGQN